MNVEKLINLPHGKGIMPNNYWETDNWKEIILPISEPSEIRLSIHLVRDVFLWHAEQGSIERKSKGVWVWKELPSHVNRIWNQVNGLSKVNFGDIYALCLIDNKPMIIPEEWEETALKK